MVDRDARNEVRNALTRLLAGTTTSDEFEKRCRAAQASADPALDGIIGWCRERLYANMAQPAQRDRADRCVRFLATGQEYLWPSLPQKLGDDLSAKITNLWLVVLFHTTAFTLMMTYFFGLGLIIMSVMLAASIGLSLLIRSDCASRAQAWDEAAARHGREAWPFANGQPG